jgi:hypothetical protein
MPRGDRDVPVFKTRHDVRAFRNDRFEARAVTQQALGDVFDQRHRLNRAGIDVADQLTVTLFRNVD